MHSTDQSSSATLCNILTQMGAIIVCGSSVGLFSHQRGSNSINNLLQRMIHWQPDELIIGVSDVEQSSSKYLLQARMSGEQVHQHAQYLFVVQ